MGGDLVITGKSIDKTATSCCMVEAVDIRRQEAEILLARFGNWHSGMCARDTARLGTLYKRAHWFDAFLYLACA